MLRMLCDSILCSSVQQLRGDYEHAWSIFGSDQFQKLGFHIFLFGFASLVCSLMIEIWFRDFDIMTTSNFSRYFNTKTCLSDVLPFITSFFPHHFQEFKGRLLEHEMLYNDEWFIRLDYSLYESIFPPLVYKLEVSGNLQYECTHVDIC